MLAVEEQRWPGGHAASSSGCRLTSSDRRTRLTAGSATFEAGRRLLAERLDGTVEPIFTPPWNRCTRDTGRCLAELGFEVLSRESRAEPLGVPRLRELPVSLDFVRLEPYELAWRFAVAAPPVGVMFHHAEMDDADMARAGELLALLAGHSRVVARPMMALV